mgnify:FL=1
MGQVQLNEERKNTTREAEAHAPLEWKPASTLEAPPAREGMRQRWIRTSILGGDESHHVMKRQREGWSPRPAKTVPDNFPVPTMDHGPFKGCVAIEGMILCEMPEVTARSRDAYYGTKADDQEQATLSDLNAAEQKGGVPIGGSVDRSHKTGTVREPQDD